MKSIFREVFKSQVSECILMERNISVFRLLLYQDRVYESVFSYFELNDLSLSSVKVGIM
jgi:hypothetical protein